MSSEHEFWLVWNAQGARAPRYQHRTAESAGEEAERLAGLNPGESFYVLHATEVRRTAEAPVERIELSARVAEADDEIPF